jgi:regulator of nucleoside diphosphate kinase
MNVHASERVLTELDHTRLSKLARAPATLLPDTVLAPLQNLLIDAHIVPSRQVREDIVTMYAQIEVRLNESKALSKIALCYPDDAEPASGFVSVLSPIGLALLGLTLGQTAHWRSPTGAPMTAQVETILFQPEASGDYVT